MLDDLTWIHFVRSKCHLTNNTNNVIGHLQSNSIVCFYHFQVGSSCMQGYRVHMEDSHTHILSLPDDPNASFFAVYDGHGGANIGKYASEHLHNIVVRRPEYQTDVSSALKKVS